MSSAFWRIIVGPLATTALAGSFWLLDRNGIAVPAPGAFLLLTVLYATWVGGDAWDEVLGGRYRCHLPPES